MTLPQRPFGQSGQILPRLGLGCMGMSDFYGPADRGLSIATIHAAQEAGVAMLDTGDFYGMGDNEMLLRAALGASTADALREFCKGKEIEAAESPDEEEAWSFMQVLLSGSSARQELLQRLGFPEALDLGGSNALATAAGDHDATAAAAVAAPAVSGPVSANPQPPPAVDDGAGFFDSLPETPKAAPSKIQTPLTPAADSAAALPVSLPPTPTAQAQAVTRCLR